MRLLFVGDVVIKNDKIKIGRELQSIIESCDYSCCNLEGPILEDPTSVLYKKTNKRGPHIYNSKYAMKWIKQAGFNYCFLANNHIMDYGQEGLDNTICMIKSEKEISYIGAGFNEEEAYRFDVLKSSKNDLSVAVISVGERQFGASIDNRAGFAWLFHEKVKELIKKAKEDCDYIIMICHMGAEGINIPLRQVRNIYRSFIEDGVSVIIGGHTHTVQGYEYYKDGHIYYSVGDFVFQQDGNPAIDTKEEGLAVLLDFTPERIIKREFVTVYDGKKIEIDVTSNSFNLSSDLLIDDKKYNYMIDQFCMDSYKKYFREYYAYVIGMYLNSEKNINSFIEHRIKKDPIKWDDLMLYHNLCIETNRWICERALQILYEESLDS